MLLPNGYKRNGSWTYCTIFWNEEERSKCKSSRIDEIFKKHFINCNIDITEIDDEEKKKRIWNDYLKNTPQKRKEENLNTYIGNKNQLNLSYNRKTEDEHRFKITKQGFMAHWENKFIADYYTIKRNYPLAGKIQNWFFHNTNILVKSCVVKELANRANLKRASGSLR